MGQQHICLYNYKHWQRHNGSDGPVQLTKETCLGHITSSGTNLDQISPSDQASTSKSQPNISILTKLKIQDLVQNPDHDSTS